MEQDKPIFPQGQGEPHNPEQAPTQPTENSYYNPAPAQPLDNSYTTPITKETNQPTLDSYVQPTSPWQTPQEPTQPQPMSPVEPQPAPSTFAEPVVNMPEVTPAVSPLIKEVVPTIAKQPTNWKLVTAVTVAGVLLVASGVLGGLLLESQKDLTETKDQLSELTSSNEDLAENNEEAKTEAEKAKEEAEKAQKNASSASKKAATAEQEANSAKADANSVRNELAVAQACAKLFDTVAGDISSYDSNMQLALAWVVKSLVSTADGYTDAAFSELETADAYYTKASAIYPRIDNTLTKVASGDC